MATTPRRPATKDSLLLLIVSLVTLWPATSNHYDKRKCCVLRLCKILIIPSRDLRHCCALAAHLRMEAEENRQENQHQIGNKPLQPFPSLPSDLSIITDVPQSFLPPPFLRHDYTPWEPRRQDRCQRRRSHNIDGTIMTQRLSCPTQPAVESRIDRHIAQRSPSTYSRIQLHLPVDALHIARSLSTMMHTIVTTIAITAQFFLALSWSTPTAAADVIGSVRGSSSRRLEQAECVCSPRTFTFRLNFNGSCNVNTIQGNQGVNGTQCELKGFPVEKELEDKTPVEVASVSIQEVNVDVDGNKHWRWKIYDGPFYDGDTIEYTSMSDSLQPGEALGDQDVPLGFFMKLTGTNAGD
eukprot:scaffold1069_cov149-Skeletonema_dohrnii-CCMP3373.AAC.2